MKHYNVPNDILFFCVHVTYSFISAPKSQKVFKKGDIFFPLQVKEPKKFREEKRPVQRQASGKTGTRTHVHET